MEWRADALADDVIEQVEDTLRTGHSSVIAVTSDRLTSAREAGLYGYRSRVRLSILSYSDMRPRGDADADVHAVVFTRLRRMMARYIGLLHYDLPTVDDKHSLLTTRVGSLADLDGLDEDAAAAGFFSHRPLLEYDGPVTPSTGVVRRRDTDLVLADSPRVTFERVYATNQLKMLWTMPFGIGGNHSYGSFLVGDPPVFSFIDLVLGDGSQVHYRRATPGTGHDATFVHEGSSWASRLSWKSGYWLIEFPGGSSYTFPACSPSLPRPCTISSLRDASGGEVRATRGAG